MKRESNARKASPGGWGEVGDERLTRYARAKADRRRGRRLCEWNGCRQKNTHVGMTNGVALMEGCEWHVHRWVRAGG